MKPATRSDSKRQQQGKADSSKVAKAPAEGFQCLQELQGPYRRTAGGLPQSAKLGIVNFPGEGAQQ